MSRETIERFYKAFAELDSKTMAACYAQDVSFEDPIFTLRGRTHVGGMWAMLCAAAKKNRNDWKIETRDITEHSAHWEATYRFSATGNMVHNVIDAEFDFDSQGLIRRHRDRFDFYRWARQALGPMGWLFGWSSWLKRKVQRTATRNLAKHIETMAGRYTT